MIFSVIETGGCLCCDGFCTAVIPVTRTPWAVVSATHQRAGTFRVAVAVALSLATEALNPVAAAILIAIHLPCGVISRVARAGFALIQFRMRSTYSRKLRSARLALPLQARKLVPGVEIGTVGSYGEVLGAPPIISHGNHGQAPADPCTVQPGEGACILVPSNLHVVIVIAGIGVFVAASDARGESNGIY